MRDATRKLIEFMSANITDEELAVSKTMIEIAASIFKKRVSLRMNQIQFADYMKVTQSMVSKWESGDYNFTIESLVPILLKLDIQLDIGNNKQNFAHTANLWNVPQKCLSLQSAS